MTFILNGVCGLIIGILIGLYIISTFNVIYHGPNSNEIKKLVWFCEQDGLYYKFDTVPYVCPPLMKNCIPCKTTETLNEID